MPFLSNSPPAGFGSQSSSSAAIDIRLNRATTASAPLLTGETEGRFCCCCCCSGCPCSSCFCRGRIEFVDSNRDAYPGEGGPGANGNTLSPQFGSITSNSSLNSLRDNSDAPVPADIVMIGRPSFEDLRNRHGNRSPAQVTLANLQRYLDDIDEDPWPHFIERSNSGTAATESSVFPFGPMELDGSMRNNVDFSSREVSTFSSYLSSRAAASAPMSIVLQGTGAGHGQEGIISWGGSFLRLLD